MDVFQRVPLLAVIFAALSLILVIVNAVLLLGNQRLEREVQGRQQFIAQAFQVNQVGNALIQALTAAASDSAIQGVMQEYGIAAPGTTPTPAPPPARKE